MRLLILTPIELEFLAVKKHLPIGKNKLIDGKSYLQTSFQGKYNSHEIILTQTGAKNNNFALAAEKAIQAYSPDIVFLIGIAGGVKDVAIGDVVIANKVYGYESGKETSDGYVARPEAINYSNDLLDLAQGIAKETTWKRRSATATNAKAYSGPIASGDKVVANSNSIVSQRIKQYFNDSIALDMEGIGFGLALQHYPQIKFINIRGISDLLDNKTKDDATGSQELAIKNATAFAFEMIYQLNFESLTSSSKIQNDKTIPSKMNYNKNQTKGSSISSGKDTHIGDKNIAVYNNYGYIALVLGVLGIAFFVSTKIDFSQYSYSQKKALAIDSLSTQVDSPLVTPPPIIDQDPKPSTPSNKPKVTRSVAQKPSFDLSTLIDLSQNAGVAFFHSNEGELADFKTAVKHQFSKNQIKVSDSFFQRGFQKKYGIQVSKFNSMELKKIGINKKINCICQIEEKITYEDSIEDGMKMYTARGKIKIHILNLTTSQLETKTISTSGAGMSEPAALESLEEHLLQSEKLNSLHTNQCK